MCMVTFETRDEQECYYLIVILFKCSFKFGYAFYSTMPNAIRLLCVVVSNTHNKSWPGHAQHIDKHLPYNYYSTHLAVYIDIHM